MERPFFSSYGAKLDTLTKPWFRNRLNIVRLLMHKLVARFLSFGLSSNRVKIATMPSPANGHFIKPANLQFRQFLKRRGTNTKATLTTQLALLETDLEAAKQIQRGFMPQDMPITNGIDIFADTRSAQWVGGDFYDLIDLSTEHLVFIVGDVSKKGISAALFMAVICKVFRTSLKVLYKPTPNSILEYANTDMYLEFARTGMFATTFIGHYDATCRKLSYANAGHSPVIYRPASGHATLLQADGAPIGILETNPCANWELDMEPGDILIAATDGLAEATNPNGEMFGYERLLSLVDTLADYSAENIAAQIFDVLGQFGAGRPDEDDQTIVILKGIEHKS